MKRRELCDQPCAKQAAKDWRPNLRYKKAGVILLDLTPAANVQGDLWDSPDTPKSMSLTKALDRSNAEYGRDTVSFAASGRKRRWGLRSEQRSPRFTTDWDELLKSGLRHSSIAKGNPS